MAKSQAYTVMFIHEYTLYIVSTILHIICFLFSSKIVVTVAVKSSYTLTLVENWVEIPLGVIEQDSLQVTSTPSTPYRL